MKYLRTALLPLLLCAGLAHSEATQMLKSTTPNNTGPATIICKGTDTNNYGRYAASAASLSYDISNAESITVHVYSDAGSTATVTIDTAPTTSGPWFTEATIANPSATGEAWSIPRNNYVRINVTWTAGNVRACIGAWRSEKKVY